MYKYLKTRKYLIPLALFALLTAILHYIALVNFLYWSVDWFDILMHFLGGATMGLLALFVFFTSGYIPAFRDLSKNKWVVFYVVLSFTLIIGLGWELWEIFFGMSNPLLDKSDVILDMIMDTIGALAVIIFDFKNRIK
jgi:hypothetical protein